MANPILKLGLPKGSLEDPTIDLFDRAGWKVRKHPRNYFPDINDPEITARLCRVQEIPLYIQDGVLDLGLTGKDWVKETKADVVVVSDLIYSKVSNKPARWVLAVADDSPTGSPKTSRANVSPPSLWACAPNISRNATSRSTSTIHGARPKPRLWKASPTPSWK